MTGGDGPIKGRQADQTSQLLHLLRLSLARQLIKSSQEEKAPGRQKKNTFSGA